MGQHDALIWAADKALKNTDTLLEGENIPFNVVYKQFKTLQSLWFRVVEDASESNSKRLEQLSIDLENAVARCEDWIKENSPLKKAAEEETEIPEEYSITHH